MPAVLVTLAFTAGGRGDHYDEDEEDEESEEQEEEAAPVVLRPVTPPRYRDSPSEEEEEEEEDYRPRRKRSPVTPDDIEPSPKYSFYYPALDGCRNVDEFEYLNRIEEGTYGVVYRGREKKSGEWYDVRS